MGHEGSVKSVFPCKKSVNFDYLLCVHTYVQLHMYEPVYRVYHRCFSEAIRHWFLWKSLSLGHGTQCFPILCFLCSFKDREQSPLLVLDERHREKCWIQMWSALSVKNPKRKAAAFLWWCPSTFTFISKAIVS